LGGEFPEEPAPLPRARLQRKKKTLKSPSRFLSHAFAVLLFRLGQMSETPWGRSPLIEDESPPDPALGIHAETDRGPLIFFAPVDAIPAGSPAPPPENGEPQPSFGEWIRASVPPPRSPDYLETSSGRRQSPQPEGPAPPFLPPLEKNSNWQFPPRQSFFSAPAPQWAATPRTSVRSSLRSGGCVQKFSQCRPFTLSAGSSVSSCFRPGHGESLGLVPSSCPAPVHPPGCVVFGQTRIFSVPPSPLFFFLNGKPGPRTWKRRWPRRKSRGNPTSRIGPVRIPRVPSPPGRFSPPPPE